MKGVGSDDAAAVCKVDPGRTPLDVYREKWGEAAKPTVPEWRHALLEVVARAYEETTGHEVVHPARRVEYHQDFDWLYATVDRLAVVEGQGRILEVYAGSGLEWGRSGTDQVPIRVRVKVQHQMMVTGMQHAEVAALFGGDVLGLYEVEADKDTQWSIKRLCADFWELVEAKKPPEESWGLKEYQRLMLLAAGQL